MGGFILCTIRKDVRFELKVDDGIEKSGQVLMHFMEFTPKVSTLQEHD